MSEQITVAIDDEDLKELETITNNIQSIKTLQDSLVDRMSQEQSKNYDWWNRMYDKYNLDPNKSYSVNRKEKTITESGKRI